jgi:hypothetical protein
MKRLLPLLLLAGCADAPAPKAPSYRELVLADTPLVYLDFTDGAAPGVAKGGVTFVDSLPGLGRAASLDGRDGRIVLPRPEPMSAGNSIELWFRAASGSRGDLVNYKIEEGARDFGLFSCLDGENSVSAYENLAHTASADGVAIEAWHHVVVTRDASSTVTLYVDGVARGSGTGGMAWDFDAPLLIGCNHRAEDPDSITFPFHGLVDEVALYRGALSPARVAAHFAAVGASSPKKADPLKPALPAFVPPAVTGTIDKEGFELLDSLDCFVYRLGHKETEPARTFKLVDGAIVCTGSPSGYMQTRRSYRNFTLRYEWRFAKPAGLKDYSKFGGNSGCLLFITAPAALGVWPKSIEIQGMNRDAGMILPIPRSVKCRFSVDEPARKGSIKPLGEWNAEEIVANEGQVTVSINGVKVSSISECELKEGPIGFQSEGAEIHWRAIRIKESK